MFGTTFKPLELLCVVDSLNKLTNLDLSLMEARYETAQGG